VRGALIAWLALCGAAHADPNAQAKAHFKQGRDYQDQGYYAKAAEEYKTAYELDRRPEMLFNIAQAYRLADDKQQALDYYQQYLAAQPEGLGAAESRQHVEELQRQIEAARAAPPPPPPPPAATELRSSPALRIAGLATAGGGAIALGIGIKFGIDARAAGDDISKHTGDWTLADQAHYEAGQRAQTIMVIAYVTGGVLVATGGVLYVLGTRTHVVPVVSASAAGAVLWGRF